MHTSSTKHWIDAAKDKPKLRGVSHVIAFFFSIYSGYQLILMSPNFIKFSTILYCISFSLVFGVSGLLHFPTWDPKTRKILRQIDHCMIFFLIATTYGLSPLLPEVGSLIIYIGWIGAILGVIYKVLLFHFIENGPKMLTSIPYIILGWACLLELPNISSHIEYLTYSGLLLMIMGGLCYSFGAICYTLKKPNLIPGYFGYHEILHIFAIIANYLFYFVIIILFNSWYLHHPEELYY